LLTDTLHLSTSLPPLRERRDHRGERPHPAQQIVTALPRHSGKPSEGEAEEQPILPLSGPIRPRPSLAAEVDPAVFPLLDGNAVEFRIRRRISADEVEDVRQMFEIWLRKIVER
jgi:hypothetical protein